MVIFCGRRRTICLATDEKPCSWVKEDIGKEALRTKKKRNRRARERRATAHESNVRRRAVAGDSGAERRLRPEMDRLRKSWRTWHGPFWLVAKTMPEDELQACLSAFSCIVLLPFELKLCRKRAGNSQNTIKASRMPWESPGAADSLSEETS